MSHLTLRIAAVLAGAALAFGAGWKVNGWRMGEQIAEMQREQIAAVSSQNEVYRLKERAMNKKVEDARNEAIQREARIRSAAAGARNAADSLRDELADLRRRIPSLTGEALRERADTLAELFGACTAEYREMAEAADRHASDAKTLSDAWPE